ncbi:HAD hydrolase-like protein, partial [Bacillus mycoides]|nr:HAD hydrolase-like protein [Bacillus mycoides]
MYTTFLFDLDGTLTDPKEGIINSVLYALEKMGIEEVNISELDS